MEKITPVRHFPKWSQDVEVSIATGWKDAIEEEERANECQRVYSDGSAVDGGVGGAAVRVRGRDHRDDTRGTAIEGRREKGHDVEPGHYLVDKFHNDLQEFLLDNDSRKLVIRWIPGHKGIAGNDYADKLAKRAARGETSKSKQLPKSLQTKAKTPLILPPSKSATKKP